jgi:hypothetical protein
MRFGHAVVLVAPVPRIFMATSPPSYRTQPAATTAMPPGIPYIVGNEAAERFSF